MMMRLEKNLCLSLTSALQCLTLLVPLALLGATRNYGCAQIQIQLGYGLMDGWMDMIHMQIQM